MKHLKLVIIECKKGAEMLPIYFKNIYTQIS